MSLCRRRAWVALACWATTTACTDAEADRVPGVSDDEIVIGTWAPLTGPAATWGSVARGIETYFDLVNREGGVHGRQLRLVVRDDAYQPSRTVAAVRQMVERERVFAIVGGVGTAPGMAVLDYLVAQGVPWVSPASGATYWAHPPKRTVFAQTTPYFDEAAVLADFAVDWMGVRSLAVVYQDDDYGRSGLVGARLALARRGLSVAAALPVDVEDGDLSAHALRLTSTGADAALMWLTPRHASILIGATERAGYSPTWLASSALADATLMHELTRGSWEGVVFAAIQELPGQRGGVRERYVEAADELAPNDRIGDFFLSGFRLAEPFVEGLRRAGPALDRDALVRALESLEDFRGLGAPITYGPDRRQGTRAAFVARAGPEGSTERLTDWIEPAIDVHEAIEALGRRR